MNKTAAQEMANKLNKIEKNTFQKKVKEVECPRQNNGYDCGIYTILMIEKILGKIKENGNIESININPKEAEEYRDYLRKEVGKIGNNTIIGNKENRTRKLHKNYIYFRDLGKRIKKLSKDR